MAITTEQVKELREKTGVSVMQCRKALEETNGDMEKAMVVLRKKGSEMAEKKSDRDVTDGRIIIKNDQKKAIVVILNCETDFVAQNEDFKNLGEKIADIAWNEGVESATLKSTDLIQSVILKIGENIVLSSIDEIIGDTVGVYVHYNAKSAGVVWLEGSNTEVAKEIAMHALAMKPTYSSSKDIDESAREEALSVMKKEVEESNKPEEIKNKMLEGKIKTYFAEQTLSEQSFFKDPTMTVEQYIVKNGGKLVGFRLYFLS